MSCHVTSAGQIVWGFPALEELEKISKPISNPSEIQQAGTTCGCRMQCYSWPVCIDLGDDVLCKFNFWRLHSTISGQKCARTKFCSHESALTCYLFPAAACCYSHHQSPDFWKVATISANGDAGIGKMVADAFEKVGKQGTITVAEAGRCWCVTGGSFKNKWGVVQTWTQRWITMDPGDHKNDAPSFSPRGRHWTMSSRLWRPFRHGELFHAISTSY